VIYTQDWAISPSERLEFVEFLQIETVNLRGRSHGILRMVDFNTVFMLVIIGLAIGQGVW
jgi:hypothetical protein